MLTPVNFLLATLMFVASTAYGQTKRTLTIDEVLRDAASKEELLVENAKITVRASSMRDTARYRTGKLVFKNCDFMDYVEIGFLTAESVGFHDCKVKGLAFLDVDLDSVEFLDTEMEELDFSTYHLEDTVSRSRVGQVSMIGSSAGRFTALFTDFVDVSLFDAALVRIRGCKIGRLGAYGITGFFELDKCELGNGRLGGAPTQLLLEGTIFHDNLKLQGVNISGPMKIVGCRFNKNLILGDLTVPSENIELPFHQVANGKLNVVAVDVVFDPMLGGMLEVPSFINTDSLTISNVNFEKQSYASDDPAYFQSPLLETLVFNYQRLFNSYRNRGDIESANACYVELKELERARLRFRYNENPSFKSFFRLQLANLLKLYTEHGTDPAKAINMSVWVMLIFAVFYFFFPSDWDVTSKGRLLQNYRDFIEKNDKGYVRPFFRLMVGFFVSFINALTLSLNSFTTLGFGNIPTHGLARYVCVLQGFIGWFLLSIFTVALINQASF